MKDEQEIAFGRVVTLYMLTCSIHGFCESREGREEEEL